MHAGCLTHLNICTLRQIEIHADSLADKNTYFVFDYHLYLMFRSVLNFLFQQQEMQAKKREAFLEKKGKFKILIR